MIELVHLQKAFEDSVPLKDVNAVIQNGDVISIIGPSGTGKSTLIRCINMLNIPTAGQVIIDGVDITDPQVDINKARQNIGMVFQSYNLYEHLSVIENVMLAQTELLGRSKNEAYEYGMKLLGRVGMAEKALQYPRQLSGGQKQRVAIARTLATDPDIILFDEPTSALDPLSVGEVEELIASLVDGERIMMIVTHSMTFAEKVANRVFFMDQGGIYEDGTPDQIFHNPQKPRTQAFIYHLNNLEIKFDKSSFDVDKYALQIYQFCLKQGIGTSTMRRMQLLFEELVVQYLFETLNVESEITVGINYNNKTDAVTITVRYEDSNKDDDQEIDKEDISFKIFKAYVKSVKRTSEGDTDIIIIEI